MYSTPLFPSVDPSTRLALANLRSHLVAEGDYSPRAITAIIAHVAAEGTVYDAPYLYPAEVDILTEVYTRGFVEVPYDDPAWGHLDGIDAVVPPAPDEAYATGDAYWAEMMAAGILRSPLPPIAGGSIDPEPFQPTPEDWAEYGRIFDQADAAARAGTRPDRSIQRPPRRF